MQTKTYYASSVPAALEQARRDLGPEASLVSSRLAPAEMSDLGKLEVTFQIDSPLPFRLSRPAAATATPARPADPGLSEIRQELLALRQAMGLTAGAGTAPESFPQADGEIPVSPFDPIPPAGCRRLAFVGPPGRGKTSTLVKIAFRFGLAAKIPVRIYCAGAHGVGCQEQLARYASILGVPFQAFEQLESLGLALDGDGWKGLTLIDTPGLSPKEVLEIGSFGRFFSRRKDVETHLVLRADATSADSLNMIERFYGLGVQRLLFTGLDEALNLNAMAAVLAQAGIPATFAGTSPEIPEGIEEMTSEFVKRSIRRNARVAAAAA